jgi:hypothetical protein
LLALWVTLVMPVHLPGLPIKIISVNHRNGQVRVLLPIHHAQIEAVLLPDEPEIRLRVNEFYDAEFEAGQIDTVKRNVLKVTIPGEKPIRLRLRKITFLSN